MSHHHFTRFVLVLAMSICFLTAASALLLDVVVTQGASIAGTAVDRAGFSAVARQVSGTAAEPLVFTLERVDTSGVPYSERLERGCLCPGDLFVHPLTR